MHTALEVTVAGEHGGRGQVAFFDGGGDFGFEGAAVSDAIVHRNSTRYEGVEVFNCDVEHPALSCWTNIGDLQRQRWKIQCFLVHAISPQWPACGAARLQ